MSRLIAKKIFGSARPSSNAVVPVQGQEITQKVKPEELDNPNYFQKIVLRFKGIPLKGEAHKPKALFDDCDKEYACTIPLPQVPKDFKEFPERDLVNYPYPERHAYPPKTRMFMFPDSWFQPFYKITGTSGFYLVLGNLTVFLLNKEILVVEENAMKVVWVICCYLLVSRAWQFRMDKYLVKKFHERVKFYQDIIAEDLKGAVEFHKKAEIESKSLKAAQENFPIIFKENLAFQLEATYRKNVDAIATELKRRLDYLQEVEATKQRFERDILLKSISEGVMKQITTNAGNIKDKYLENCIAQLNAISYKNY